MDILKKYKSSLFISGVILILFTACGSSTSADNYQEDKKLVTGVFIDGVVSGLEYNCSSGAQGMTDVNGEYICPEDDNITFFLGSILLGTTSVVSIITPHTLYPDNVEAAVNLAQLLQTLDDDSNVSNGIIISPPLLEIVETETSNISVDFTSASFDTNIQNAFGVKVILVNENDAKEHLNESYVSLGLEPPQDSIVCNQVVTYAQNPNSGECKEFSTPCHVPNGWKTCIPIDLSLSNPPIPPQL
jgi:hypothetical protein